MQKVILTLLICCYSSILLASGDKETEFKANQFLTIAPTKIDEIIAIDGKLETNWFASAAFENFTEYEPSESKKPQVNTRGYITFDSQNLYVAFICQDPNMQNLRASLSDRDKIFDDDWVSISIDPDKDSQKAYQFFVNARGIQGDRLWQSNGNEDDSFDLVWESNAQIFEDSWAVEMKIPFESLRFPNVEEQNWSVHFTRQYPRDDVYKFSWMPISQNNNSLMAQAGDLAFKLPVLKKSKRTLEVLPYAISTQHSFREETANSDSWQHENPNARTGFGVKYGISSNFIADFSYNPDFSQIESDNGQISINNPFALFFAEKRPFFQEGRDVYQIDQTSRAGGAIDQYVNLFYSRSINDPQFAGKLSGKLGKVSVGLTSAYDRNTPFIIPFEEETSVLATQKKSHNNIARARYEFGNQSSVGMTLTDRRYEGSGSNSVAALDANYRLSDRYNLSAIAAFTHTNEIEDEELSDNIGAGKFKVGSDSLTTAFDGESFNGRLLRAKINRESRHWVSTLAYQDYSPGFRADNGFFQVNSFRSAEFVNAYFFRFEKNPVFNHIKPRVAMWRKYNYDGVVKDTGLRTSLEMNLKKQTYVNMSAFIFNRENLFGRQFGDARLIWMFVRNRALKSLWGTFFINIGDQINRLGEIGNPHNPYKIVPSLRYSFSATLKPLAKLSNEMNFSSLNLWLKYGGEKIVGQKILRNTFSYQFSKRMFLRLITEYNIVEYFDDGAGQMVKSKNFALDPLFSYKLNPFSVFFIGGHFGARNNLTLDRQVLKFDDQSLFVKFQYLFRS